MKIEAKIISREFIRPSSPTPSHLRHLHFSFLDQTLPDTSSSLILFYTEISSSNISKICELLKKSLSEILTMFYPVAGRIRNDTYIDCNDEGLLLVEASVNCELSKILREKDPNNNNYFVPFRPDEGGDLAAFSQITVFKNGGLAISFGISHKLGDASSIFTFVNSWASVARGDTNNLYVPSFGYSTYFPPINNYAVDRKQLTTKEKLVTKLFVFDRSSITELKGKYDVDKGQGRRGLSTSEALMGFILCSLKATSPNIIKPTNPLHMVLQPVDLRSKMEPPLPKGSFGNLVMLVRVEAENVYTDDSCFEIVWRLRDSIRSIDLKQIPDLDEISQFSKDICDKYTKEEVVPFIFSSLQKFGPYETDFGWGKPIWLGTTPMVIRNLIYFSSDKAGRNVEVYACLKEEDMAKFEMAYKLLAYASSTSNAQSRL